MRQKNEEYQRAVEEDKRQREERRTRIVEETKKLIVRNMAAVRGMIHK